MTDVLLFTIPGRVVSNNSIARASGGRVHKGTNARGYQEIATGYIAEAVAKAGWEIPPCARVKIVVCNTWIDADNAPKLIMDSLRGWAIVDDNRDHVRSVLIDHAIDAGGPRVEVTVTPCEPLERLKRSRAKKSSPEAPKPVTDPRANLPAWATATHAPLVTKPDLDGSAWHGGAVPDGYVVLNGKLVKMTTQQAMKLAFPQSEQRGPRAKRA